MRNISEDDARGEGVTGEDFKRMNEKIQDVLDKYRTPPDHRREMKTVRELFSKAFGEVPEGATCHIGATMHVSYGGENFGPFALIDDGAFVQLGTQVGWLTAYKNSEPFGPDISDRPAESFRGFFGAEFDSALDAEGEK